MGKLKVAYALGVAIAFACFLFLGVGFVHSLICAILWPVVLLHWCSG